ncbi:MAG: hypothetical protein ACREOZ_04615, partial [Gloeomargaritales cyanobacterium]
ACTLRLADTVFLGDGYKEGVKGDAWFGSVKAAAELGKQGKMAVLQIKMGFGLFPKKFIEETMKDAPGGTHVVLEGTHPNGTDLIAIGYRYNAKTTLHFVMTTDAFSTRPGPPYEMKYADRFGNVQVRMVTRPRVISEFFENSNCIDLHNQARQSDLALEKCWQTMDPWFRLHTTLIGINVVNTHKLCDIHHLFLRQRQTPYNRFEETHEDDGSAYMTVKKFAGRLSNHLLKYANMHDREDRGFSSGRVSSVPAAVTASSSSDEVSNLSENDQLICVRVLEDVNGVKHYQMPYPSAKNKNGKKYAKARECLLCRSNEATTKKNSCFYCATCDRRAFCCPSSRNGQRDCFKAHVDAVARQSGRLNCSST